MFYDLYPCICLIYFLIKLVFSYRFQDELTERAIKLSAREKRFIKFASVEFDGQIYMTPQDFLESVVEQEPRRKSFCVKIP